MGNYYEGNLLIPLRKDIPDKLKNALFKISKHGNDEIPNEYIDQPCFQHERWNYPCFNFGSLLKEEDGSITTIDDIDGLNIQPINEIYEFIKKSFYCYYLRIDFCMKGYMQLGELYVNWLRPFMIKDKAFNYIGEIKDEDGTYHKKFYVDKDWLKQEERNRDYLCKDCPNKVYGLCDFYNICKRAYDLGKCEM